MTRCSLRPPQLLPTALVGVLQTTLFTGPVILALSIGGAGKVAVPIYTMPSWLLLLAWAFLRERLRGLPRLAVGLACVGLVLVVKFMQGRHDIDVFSLAAWQIAIGSIPLVAIAALTYGGVQWTPSFFAALAYTVLLANMLAWTLWFFALRSLRAGLAGLGTLAVPVVGVLAACQQLGERPAAAEAVGIGLILAGLTALAAAGLRAAGREPAVRPASRSG